MVEIDAALPHTPRIQLIDERSAVVRQAGVVVTAELAVGPEGATLLNATATTDSGGGAVFTDLAVRGEIGRYQLRFRAAGLPAVVSTSFVLVPSGVIGALSVSGTSGAPPILKVVNAAADDVPVVDGLDAVALAPDGAAGLDWHPGRAAIVLHQARVDGSEIALGQVLYTVSREGELRRLISEDHGLLGETWPQYTSDGAWIYFSARLDHQDGEIWRVRADGSGAERIGPPVVQWGDLDTQPSPSPDGKRVVFASTRAAVDGTRLSILEVETGAVTQLPLQGWRPRWSPTGEWIAYLEGGLYTPAIRLVRPDGSDAQILTFPDALFRTSVLDWSPDGKYLLVRGREGLEIVDVARRTFVALPRSSLLQEAAWMP